MHLVPQPPHSRFTISMVRPLFSAAANMSRDIPTDLPTGKRPCTGGRILRGIPFSGRPTLTPTKVEDLFLIWIPEILLTRSHDFVQPSPGISLLLLRKRSRHSMSSVASSPVTITSFSESREC